MENRVSELMLILHLAYVQLKGSGSGLTFTVWLRELIVTQKAYIVSNKVVYECVGACNF